MKIVGLGNDICEIERIAKSIEKHGNHFLDRLFTKTEIAYCQKHKDPAIHFAGRFCAKESIAKALGTGFGKELAWLDLEIINNAEGKPEVHLHGELKKQLQGSNLEISISHCRSYATAVAIHTKD